jgi:hypothetical protein
MYRHGRGKKNHQQRWEGGKSAERLQDGYDQHRVVRKNPLEKEN